MTNTKIVNIIANVPIKNVEPPIYGKKSNVTMTLNDILKCLFKRAIIEEVLVDGSTVRLDMKNFREDFNGPIIAKREAELKIRNEMALKELERKKAEKEADKIGKEAKRKNSNDNSNKKESDTTE